MMLIKTAEPNRQIERMLEKSVQRRRLAHRQDRTHDTLQAVVNATIVVSAVMQDISASSRVLQHARPLAVPIRPKQNLSPGRLPREDRALTRWHVFGDMFL